MPSANKQIKQEVQIACTVEQNRFELIEELNDDIRRFQNVRHLNYMDYHDTTEYPYVLGWYYWNFEEFREKSDFETLSEKLVDQREDDFEKLPKERRERPLSWRWVSIAELRARGHRVYGKWY
jgi:hypothetical protein